MDACSRPQRSLPAPFPSVCGRAEITRPDSDWYKTNGCVGYRRHDASQCFQAIAPGRRIREKPYSFVAVDGGTIDNEPLELARRYLLAARTAQ